VLKAVQISAALKARSDIFDAAIESGIDAEHAQRLADGAFPSLVLIAGYYVPAPSPDDFKPQKRLH
jgi:hypothetical protein